MQLRPVSPPIAALALLAAGLAAACGGPTDVDDVELGSKVAVTTTDGSKVEGKLVQLSEDAVVVQREATGQRDTIERSAIAEVREQRDSPIDELIADKPKWQEVTVPAGTLVPLTLDVALGSDANHVEDPVAATVRSPITVDGFDAIPARATLRGQVTRATPAGDVKGRAALAFRFDQLTIDHQDYDISTKPLGYQAAATKKEDAAKIGAGAGIGSAVGAIAGGKKGALIGAAVGGGAGTAVVLTTSGKEVHLAPGAELRAELAAPVIIRVPLE